jgi:hypothetical protein
MLSISTLDMKRKRKAPQRMYPLTCRANLPLCLAKGCTCRAKREITGAVKSALTYRDTRNVLGLGADDLPLAVAPDDAPAAETDDGNDETDETDETDEGTSPSRKASKNARNARPRGRPVRRTPLSMRKPSTSGRGRPRKTPPLAAPPVCTAAADIPIFVDDPPFLAADSFVEPQDLLEVDLARLFETTRAALEECKPNDAVEERLWCHEEIESAALAEITDITESTRRAGRVNIVVRPRDVPSHRPRSPRRVRFDLPEGVPVPEWRAGVPRRVPRTWTPITSSRCIVGRFVFEATNRRLADLPKYEFELGMCYM